MSVPHTANHSDPTHFHQFGLHGAAGAGDLSLMRYALECGQPVNSVSEGLFPLHAACASGRDSAVRLLLEHGAHVNARRLPYDHPLSPSTALSCTGTPGCSPLHFAAACGHVRVVRTLLLHGAYSECADEHGVTPEMLARSQGWGNCADAIARWIKGKDRTLRGEEALVRIRSQTRRVALLQCTCGHGPGRDGHVRTDVGARAPLVRPVPLPSTPATYQAPLPRLYSTKLMSLPMPAKYWDQSPAPFAGVEMVDDFKKTMSSPRYKTGWNQNMMVPGIVTIR